MAKPSEKTITALVDRALEAGKIEKSGNWFSFAGERLGNGKAASVAFLIENAAVVDKIEAALAPDATDKSVADSAGLKSRTDQSEQEDRADDLIPQGGAVSASTAPPAIAQPGATPVTLSFPLPTGASRDDLKNASIVVMAKPPQGRRRAGRAFTREETLIPYADLDDEQIAALTGDPELIVTLRLPKPD